MAAPTWTRALILGGIRSGKSEYAEELLAAAAAARATAVTFVATARRDPADAGWTARIDRHLSRRPDGWATAEVGDRPDGLLDLLEGAKPDEALLVDDIGAWVAGRLGEPGSHDEIADDSDVTEVTPAEQFVRMAHSLAAAVRACPATLVLVSPEVGLSVVPATPIGLAFADALGLTNRAIAAECDTVALVIAGNAVPVKGAL
jgi:nicotinate-nucleotide--dimethylbenzimidazole phosphoribosyltransferase